MRLKKEKLAIKDEITQLEKELVKTFKNKFGNYQKRSRDHYIFENDICDYFQYQGYRFIIQFYLPGFISKFRQEKINKLLYGH